MPSDFICRFIRTLTQPVDVLVGSAIALSDRSLAIAVDDRGAFAHVRARPCGNAVICVWDDASENLLRSVATRYNPLARGERTSLRP